MNMALFCASERGVRFARRLTELAPDDTIHLFSFPEDPWEKPFFEDIRRVAAEAGCPFHEMRSMKPEVWQEPWEAMDIDLLFCVGWRYLVPKCIYETTRIASVVFHDSYLPKYRGFAPTNWAIINGEDHTGASMFLMAEEVDSGPIIDQEKVPIYFEDTIAEVAERVTQTYLKLIEKNLPALRDGTFAACPQEGEVTMAARRRPKDGEIDWGKSAVQVYNLVRALAFPWPGAFTYLNGRKLLVWFAEPVDGPVLPPGTLCVDGTSVTVATGEGHLRLKRVQFEDGVAEEASTALTGAMGILG